MKKFITPLWLIMIVALSVSCAAPRQAKLDAGKDPQKAVAEVSQVMARAQQDQIDVLADNQYEKGVVYLEDARRALKQKDNSEAVLENAAIAKALFEDARETAKGRDSSASRILEARASALAAGVRNSVPLVETLKDIDNDLKGETKHFSRALSTKDFSAFQKRYLALEARAVQFRELNSAKQAIDQAMEQNADDLAPKTLQAASLDYETAINIIARSPRSPAIYKKNVDTALESATLLYDVMNVIKGAKGTPENIALQIVKQKRQLGELSSNVGKLKENLASAQQAIQEKEGALKETKGKLEQTEGVLKTQEEQLAQASTQVRFQQAMDEAREQISPDDALVYQQGNKLVFRLKRMNFPSGTAVIPEFSKLLLAKVNAIIKKLDADNVIVQGHTDSVGSEQVNQKLSKERAAAVANYLYEQRGGYKIQYVGYGEAHPIASNENAAGRAMNRRVDLVVSVKQ